MGKLIFSKRSQGSSGTAPTHSLSGIQKSKAGIRSCTLRSSLIIVKSPKETYTRLCWSRPQIKRSSNTRRTQSGIFPRSTTSSSAYLQQPSPNSVIFAPRHMGSTTSASDTALHNQCGGIKILIGNNSELRADMYKLFLRRKFPPCSA